MKKALVVGFILGLAATAFAADPVVCAVTTATGAAASTSSPTTGTCSWSPGSVILMQCTTDTYIDTAPGGTASSADQRVDFTSNSDPYIIYLNNADQHVSVLAVTSAGSCKFMKTQRARPWR